MAMIPFPSSFYGSMFPFFFPTSTSSSPSESTPPASTQDFWSNFLASYLGLAEKELALQGQQLQQWAELERARQLSTSDLLSRWLRSIEMLDLMEMLGGTQEQPTLARMIFDINSELTRRWLEWSKRADVMRMWGMPRARAEWERWLFGPEVTFMPPVMPVWQPPLWMQRQGRGS